MQTSKTTEEIKVGDLVQLRHHEPRDAGDEWCLDVALVVSTAAIIFDRIQIEWLDTNMREMAPPKHLKLVSST